MADEDNRVKELLLEFTILANEGYPKGKMVQYDAKVAGLSYKEREELKALTKTVENLKTELTGEDCHRK